MDEPLKNDSLTPSDSTQVPADTTADAEDKLTYLALGDSYTIGESVGNEDRWPVQLVDSLNTEDSLPDFQPPQIIARTGWRTDQLIAGIRSANLPDNYDLTSLLIGVNNQYQNKAIDVYTVEFEELLQTAIKKAGGRPEHVFVVSIPDYGYTPFGKYNQQDISKELDEYNAIARKICKDYDVLYVYITDLSRNGLSNPDLVADDGLHPSGKQYALWVERIMYESDFFKQLK